MLLLSALTLMTLDLRDTGEGPLARVQHAGAVAFAPVQQAVATLARPFVAAATWTDDQRGLHRELRRLRAVAAERDRLAVERDEARAENATLRRLLDMRQRSDLRTVGARSLGPVPGDPGSTVLIDAGAADGLVAEAAVVDARGVVGRLVAVSGRYARVELITSPRARYAVRVVAGRHTGRLHGRGDGGLQLELDDPSGRVPSGSAVVTRAFAGSTVPDGLPVGTVSGGAGGTLEVRPAAALGALDVVQVVVAMPVRGAR